MHSKPVPTQTSKARKRYDEDHFDRPVEKDFITEKNRTDFHHICGKCAKKKYCEKWKAAIVIKCDQIDFKGVKYGEK